jgi:branched-chain amino acid transport system ATP-binding protein
MAPLLAIDDLRVHFGGVRAVDGVSLVMEPGRLYGLVGPNGSGKTTLINAISRLVPLTGGRIDFRREAVHALSPHEVSSAGITRTFQGIRLLPTLTVRENVMLGADAVIGVDAPLWRRRAARARRVADAADRAIERLALGDLAGDYPTSLSYGTQRRVEIARAIASDPSLLLLDEPVAGMSREERAEISAVVRSLRAEGLTQLLIEHDLRLIQELSDHLFVMNFGRLVAEGEPQSTAELPAVQEAYLGRKHVVA